MSDANVPKPEKNRRLSRRLPPRGKARVTCYKGTLDLGANLALKLLDISESGLRLVVKTALDKGQEVLVTLEGQGHLRPVKRLGKVVWTAASEDGNHAIGIRFDKALAYADFLHIT